MILTCPQCNSRFLLSAFALAPEGRRVKCSGCSEIWFQKPDPEEAGIKPGHENIEVEFREIPESVKPLRDGANVPVIPKSGKKMPASVLAGYAAAFAVFIGVFALLTVARQPVVDRWLPAALFYETIGFPVSVPGEGLMFDQVDVTAEDKGDGETITIKGRILNVAQEERALPELEAEVRDEAGKIIGRLPIPLSESAIETGQGVDFKISFSPEDKKTAEIRLYFSLGGSQKIRTAAEGGGNTPAPAPDAETHPHDPEGGA